MPPLIQIKERLAPSIGLMHQMVLRCIFDKESLLPGERAALDEAIKTWRKVIDCPPDVLWEVKRIENALIADEQGHWERAKQLIKEHKLNYRLKYSHGIPFVADPYKCRTFGKG